MSCKAMTDVCKQVINRLISNRLIAIAFQVAAKSGENDSQQIVFVPKLGETVDATTESFIYQVNLFKC